MMMMMVWWVLLVWGHVVWRLRVVHGCRLAFAVRVRPYPDGRSLPHEGNGHIEDPIGAVLGGTRVRRGRRCREGREIVVKADVVCIIIMIIIVVVLPRSFLGSLSGRRSKGHSSSCCGPAAIGALRRGAMSCSFHIERGGRCGGRGGSRRRGVKGGAPACRAACRSSRLRHPCCLRNEAPPLWRRKRRCGWVCSLCSVQSKHDTLKHNRHCTTTTLRRSSS